MLDPNDFPAKLTINDLCELFGAPGAPLSKTTMWRWVKEGKIPAAAHQITKRTFWWDKASVLAHLGLETLASCAEAPDGHVSKESFEELERRVKAMEAKFKRFAEVAA